MENQVLEKPISLEEVSNSSSATDTMDTIVAYYQDGNLIDFDLVTIEDDYVLVVHYSDVDQGWVVDIFENDHDYVDWWELQGADQADIDLWWAYYNVRNYAIEHNIVPDYDTATRFSSFPQHFQEYVINEIGHPEQADKNGSTVISVQAGITSLWAGYNATGTNRTYSGPFWNYGNFNNTASSALALGLTTLCNFNWFGGARFRFGIGSSVEPILINNLSWFGFDNAANSHF